MCLDGIFRECIGGSDTTVYSNMVMQWYIVCGIRRGGIRRSKVLSGWGCECDDGDGCVCLGGKCCDDIVVVYCERVGGVTTVQYMRTR